MDFSLNRNSPCDEESWIFDDFDAYTDMSLFYELGSVLNGLGHVAPDHDHGESPSTEGGSGDFIA
jgi:hypothetical protein